MLYILYIFSAILMAVQEVLNRMARMHFDARENILHIAVLENALMDLEAVQEHYAMIDKLTQQNDHYALIDCTFQYTLTSDAAAYVARPEVLKHRKAAAYVHPTLVNRLQIMQLQMKLRSLIPIRVFATKNEALQWICSLQLIKK